MARSQPLFRIPNLRDIRAMRRGSLWTGKAIFMELKTANEILRSTSKNKQAVVCPTILLWRREDGGTTDGNVRKATGFVYDCFDRLLIHGYLSLGFHRLPCSSSVCRLLQS